MKINKTDCLKIYHNMLLIRKFEAEAARLYGLKEIGGFCHIYTGQEAIASGLVHCYNEKEDQVITSYRDHGLALVCGMTAEGVMGELTGRATGCSRGKGGSMHIFDLKNNFYGGHGIVGAQVPLGTGIAFRNKYLDSKAICYTFLGDGAVNQGQVYESFNMASLWGLSVIYIIENNQYGMGTSVARSSCSKTLHERAAGFNMLHYAVDGMSVISVIEGLQKAIKHCQKEQGPVLIEMNTYRYRGHSMSDPANYRTKEELQNMKDSHDSIDNFVHYVIDNKIASIDEVDKIEKEIKALIKTAVKTALESPEPSEDELFTDVYN